jgi:hypothetical protein
MNARTRINAVRTAACWTEFPAAIGLQFCFGLRGSYRVSSC